MRTKASKIHNIVYKITNLINQKIYIGVHKTNNINDNYMGSGIYIKNSIKKYGKHNFKKEILADFSSYEEALEMEKILVTEEFIESNDNYNLKTGGWNQIKWSSEMITHLSKKAKELWESPTHQEKMRIFVYDNTERNAKFGKAKKDWILNNPEQHKQKMEAINKNPSKIEKTRQSHLGKKRSEDAKLNIKNAERLKKEKDPEQYKKSKGCGMRYIHNMETKEILRISKDETIPDGWQIGFGKRKK